MTKKTIDPLHGWNGLRHGGLLFDSARLTELAKFVPGRLNDYTTQKLRQHANATVEEPSNRSQFVRFVLETICGIDERAGFWNRGSSVALSWSRQTVTGESPEAQPSLEGKEGWTAACLHR